LIRLAYEVGGKNREGIAVLNRAAGELEKMLAAGRIKGMRKIAATLANFEHVYVVGRGSGYPVAMEIALKIKESSYVHAEAFAGGELKHGVIALIETGTPAIVVAVEDETLPATLSGAQELKARGATIIGLSPIPQPVFDRHIRIPEGEIPGLMGAVLAGQLLGFYMALAKGLDPDMPRNLAKSVTVK
jgi:glucosamine--fructose-6-phosphate aminotransferase (isomerizing)